MCDARCKRCERGASPRFASRRSSETWPAVLHRHCATENLVTGPTQSRDFRSELRVSFSPNPSGLTTPAATTATRAVAFLPFALLGSTMVEKKDCPAISIAFLQQASYK